MRTLNYDTIVIVDLETTGVDETVADIIEIGTVVVDGTSFAQLDTRACYVQPEHWEMRDPEAMAINKISAKTLMSQGVSLQWALEHAFHDISWDNTLLAAWGIDFETRFLREAYRRIGQPTPWRYRTLDIRTAAWYHLQRSRPHWVPREYPGLEAFCEQMGVHVNKEQLHGALYDAVLTARVLDAMSAGVL